MKAVPLLLRPRVLALTNRWRREPKAFVNVFRDIALVGIGIGILVGIYRGTNFALQRIGVFAEFAYLPPATPLSVLLLFLFVMLVLSSSVVAIGSFFLSQDNQLILAAPVNRFRFFASKLTTVILSTAWMPLIFLAPFLFSFGVHYGGSSLYYLSWPLVLLPYFVIPATIAFLLSLFVVTLIPPSQTRLLLIFVVILFIGFIVNAGSLIRDGLSTGGNLEELLRILTVLSFPDALWLPSHWAALSFDELLEGNDQLAVAPLALLWVVSVLLIAVSYAMFSILYPLASSRASNRRRYIAPFLKLSKRPNVGRWVPIPSFSLLMKDYRVLYRDMPQVVQLLLLVVIFLVYLYNLRIFGILEALGEDERATWLAFFFIANASMGAFITTAAATRLVFPSVSLEGRSFWILQTAPITHNEILKNKFWTWYLPIGCLASLTFTAGNVALNTGPLVTMATFVVGWFLSAGLISLGLGIGTMFARFDWEHSAQLIASFGSLVFMLSSIFLITVNMIPLGIALFIREPGMMGDQMSDQSWMLLVACCALFILLVNVLVVMLSFHMGERALAKQLRS